MINVTICNTPSVPFGCRREDYEVDAYQVIGHGVNPGWFYSIEDAIEYIESYVDCWYEHELNRYRHGWVTSMPDRRMFADGWKIAAIGRRRS